jgi:hypothetical protein
MSKSKPNTKLLKPSIPTLAGDDCQYEIYSQEKNAMVVCGKPVHYIGKQVFNVCTEHYDYMTALGFKAKERKK